MAQFENSIVLETHEDSPAQYSGTSPGYARGTRRGEQVVQNVNEQFYAIEGAYFVLSTPTAATAVASQASVTAYDATKDVLHIRSAETVKSVLVRYIKMYMTVAPGGSGTQIYEFRLDTTPGAVTPATGGTLTNRRVNLAVAAVSGNVVGNVGAITTVAGSTSMSAPYSGLLRNGIGLANDSYIFTFGEAMAGPTFVDVATTGPQSKTIAHGPLIIPPGGALRMSHYGASLSTAASYFWEVGCILR